MSIINALEKYTSAFNAIKSHEEGNKQVFDQHKKLVMQIIDAENELRDEAAKAAEGMKKNTPTVVESNGQFRVIVTAPTQVVFNKEKIEAAGLHDAITENNRPPQIVISNLNK